MHRNKAPQIQAHREDSSFTVNWLIYYRVQCEKNKNKRQTLSKVDEQSFFAACLTQAVAIGTDTDINGERLQRLPQVSASRPSSLQAKRLLSQLTTSAID